MSSAARYWWPVDGGLPAFQGLRVLESAALRDGDLAVAGVTILLGTRPWTELEKAGELGRRIVRHGLADVLAWLREDPGPAPDDPYPFHGARDLLAALARAGDLRPPVEDLADHPIDHNLTAKAYEALASGGLDDG